MSWAGKPSAYTGTSHGPLPGEYQHAFALAQARAQQLTTETLAEGGPGEGEGHIWATRKLVSLSFSRSGALSRKTPAPSRKVWVAWNFSIRSQKWLTENFCSITTGRPSTSARSTLVIQAPELYNGIMQ